MFRSSEFIPYFRLLVFGILVTLVVWFSLHFFRLAHLALQNVNKDYVIFLYFCNLIAKSDQKPRTKKMRWTKQWYCRRMKIQMQFHESSDTIMHGGHYSYCKEKWKEKWAWTKESCFEGLWMILNIFAFSNIKNLIGTKNKTFLICRLMNFNPICSHT